MGKTCLGLNIQRVQKCTPEMVKSLLHDLKTIYGKKKKAAVTCLKHMINQYVPAANEM